MGYLFTSESVSEGHPDKLCDQISDGILDAVVAQDPHSRVAVETFATTGLVVIGGEVTTSANVDYVQVARDVICDIGYTNPDFGMDGKSCAILCNIHCQSQDIAQGVNVGDGLDQGQGAGDQGIMFGYACKQTDSLMPLPIDLSHNLVKKLSEVRKSGELSYLRPDAKAQVTVEYDEEHTPQRVDAVVVSTQHSPDVSHDHIVADVKEHVLNAVIPSEYLDSDTKYYINPTGRFVVGGPHGDAGLTGRKIIVDTYGGWARHGGGAFSGKDCTKVDRSAAYMARYVAKNLVAADIADEIEIQLSYAIGVSHPVSVHVETRGTGRISNADIVTLIRDTFDLSPQGIQDALQLCRPIFRQTAAYGHFGRNDCDLPWEKLDKVDALKKKALISSTISV